MGKIDKEEVAFFLTVNILVVSAIAIASYEILKGVNVILK